MKKRKGAGMSCIWVYTMDSWLCLLGSVLSYPFSLVRLCLESSKIFRTHVSCVSLLGGEKQRAPSSQLQGGAEHFLEHREKLVSRAAWSSRNRM